MGPRCWCSAGQGRCSSSRSSWLPTCARFGGYTVPDFLGERFGGTSSQAARRAGGGAVLVSRAGPDAVGTGRHRHAAVRRRASASAWRSPPPCCCCAASPPACARRASRKSSNMPCSSPPRSAIWRCCSGSKAPCCLLLDPVRVEAAFDTCQASDLRRRGRHQPFALLFCLVAGIASLPPLLDAQLGHPRRSRSARLVSVGASFCRRALPGSRRLMSRCSAPRPTLRQNLAEIALSTASRRSARSRRCWPSAAGWCWPRQRAVLRPLL